MLTAAATIAAMAAITDATAATAPSLRGKTDSTPICGTAAKWRSMKDGSLEKAKDGSACLAGGAREAGDRVDEIPLKNVVGSDHIGQGNDEDSIPPQVQEWLDWCAKVLAE